MLLKALFKKQLRELVRGFMFDPRTGKQRSKGFLVFFIILYAFMFLSFGFSFFSTALVVGGSLMESGKVWILMSVMATISFAFGVFGSSFSTYSTLYAAKDNEFLLSMPVKPSQILTVRMSIVLIMSVLFTSVAWLPSMIAFWIVSEPSAAGFILPPLVGIGLICLNTAVSCVFGWLISIVASKIKNKAVITVIITAGIIAIYYVVYFRFTRFFNGIAENPEVIEKALNTWLYPFKIAGTGAAGSWLEAVLFTVLAAVVFAAVMFVITKTFVKLVTDKKSAGTKKKRAENAERRSLGRTLLRKELKRYTSSPSYMLNTGFGLLMLLAISVAAVIYRNPVREMVSGLIPDGFPVNVSGMLAVAALAAVMFILSSCYISAASVSMEGKTFWILRSLPVDMKELIKAKVLTHVTIAAPAAVVAAVLLGIAFGEGWIAVVLMAVEALAFTVFFAAFGLTFGIKWPVLDWISEAVPVKQGMAVGFAFLAGILSINVFVTPGFAVAFFAGPEAGLAAMIVVTVGLTLIVRRWLLKKGVRLLNEL